MENRPFDASAHNFFASGHDGRHASRLRSKRRNLEEAGQHADYENEEDDIGKPGAGDQTYITSSNHTKFHSGPLTKSLGSIEKEAILGNDLDHILGNLPVQE